MRWNGEFLRGTVIVIHLVATRVTDMLSEGRVRRQEVRKVPLPCRWGRGGVRWGGVGGGGGFLRSKWWWVEVLGDKKKTLGRENKHRVVQGWRHFRNYSDWKRKWTHANVSSLSSVFFQSYWAPPRDSTSTTKTPMGTCLCCCVRAS